MDLKTFCIIGGIFIFALGCLCHFFYEWSGHNKFIGFFTAVNESTWEHLKLLVVPSFLWLIAEIHLAGSETTLFAHSLGLLAGLIFIPTFFAAYKAVLRRDILIFDILAFALAAAIEQFIFFALASISLTDLVALNIMSHIGLILLILIAIIFLTHTFLPEKIPLFRDPVTKKYGFTAHNDKLYKKHIKASHKKYGKKHRK